MSNEPIKESDPSGMWTVVTLTSFFILVFVVIVALQAIFFRVKTTELEGKVINRLPEELIEMREEQQALLSGYRWIDKEAGIAAVPIDRAMELFVQEQSRPVGEQ